jgi:hypothetical protein
VWRDRPPPFVPPKKRKSIRRNPEKFGERSVIRQEDYILERGKNALSIAFTGMGRGD